VTSDADFERQLEAIDKSLEAAVERVMDAKPDAFILGISALSVWGGTLDWGEDLSAACARWPAGHPVAIASDAVAAVSRRRGSSARSPSWSPTTRA